ncbi:aminopeptidase [Flavobacterium sp.]|uniref:aminopeptidase n=1 Tax=Flavobacterium sp. TaxID=239 RepID=UPI0038FD23EB
MKPNFKIIVLLWLLFLASKQYAQHHSQIHVEVKLDNKTLIVNQEIEFYNQSKDTISYIVLNDWNNAYSSKNSPLAKRFSDEFYRGFHFSNEEERGFTKIISIENTDKIPLVWKRTANNPDLVIIELKQRLAPNTKIKLVLSYIVKIPSNKFTRYGYVDNEKIILKNWFLTPSRYENHAFVQYNNNNLDDIANGISDFDIRIKTPKNIELISDLNISNKLPIENSFIYELNGKNRTDFNIYLESKLSFSNFKNNSIEVVTNLKEKKINDIEKAIIINNIIDFTERYIGKYPHEKITVSEVDYDRNPFYGLNQLPSFLRPFSDDFVFEIKFLKTYLNNYLKYSLKLDPRKDNWIYDGIQVYMMLKYIDEYYPESKMMGRISEIGALKNYCQTQLNFNQQYSYFYMLMARKNLDQALGSSKNQLIKFNEQIAGKYKAGLCLKYLSKYLEENAVNKSILDFYNQNKDQQTSQKDFETILKFNTKKDISWFFKTMIDSRDIIDFKISNFSKTKDSIHFSLNNKTNIKVPIAIYGLNKDKIVFKEWLYPKNTDSTFSYKRKGIDRLVLNYENEVPEFNLRNNFLKTDGFFPNNKPIKFVFMKDFEDPNYNQILYVPSIGYNLYDGISPGMRLHNRTILDKPFNFDINPAYSTTSKSLTGSALFFVNQFRRNSNLFNIRYSLSGSYFHYAKDASYLKINPAIQFHFRETNFRDNHKQIILARYVTVNREKSSLITNTSEENYSVFNLKYINTKTEITNHLSFVTDFQLANKFGKVSGQIEYRKLFEDNRQLKIRLFTGSFLYNKTDSDFFSFATDRPTDYLFDYNFFGRSESTGIYSQQYIEAEGGFKSKLKNPFANQWITTFNNSFSIWNWVEAYSDFGLLKNLFIKEKFIYDSGIRLNLVPDYFELYFPIYSNNGWEIGQSNYSEKIRFMVTFSPKTLTTLFTRKWF